MYTSVQWGEFKLGDLFEIATPQKKFNANAVDFRGKYRYVARGEGNNGVRGYISEAKEFLNPANTISFGQDTATIYYQDEPYFTGDKIKILTLKNRMLTQNNAVCLISAMKKAFSTFAWGSSSFSVKVLENVMVFLPITEDKKPNFSFMEKFVRELELARIRELELARIRELAAYLSFAGLTDTKLTKEEEKAIEMFENEQIKVDKFTIGSLFDTIEQGARLRKEDQRAGDIPFVMAGVTNTGVVGNISNPVRTFPKNSLTIDIFGNVFYRNYSYGAGDDTGVYRNEKNKIAKLPMLFLVTAIGKAINGKYSYGNKLRSSRSLGIEVYLPTKQGKPDYAFMETLVSAVQKLVIKDVVKYSDMKIKMTKNAIKSQKIEKYDMVKSDIHISELDQAISLNAVAEGISENYKNFKG